MGLKSCRIPVTLPYMIGLGGANVHEGWVGGRGGGFSTDTPGCINIPFNVNLLRMALVVNIKSNTTAMCWCFALFSL